MSSGKSDYRLTADVKRNGHAIEVQRVTFKVYDGIVKESISSQQLNQKFTVQQI